jgi:hypothetical protein
MRLETRRVVEKREGEQSELRKILGVLMKREAACL